MKKLFALMCALALLVVGAAQAEEAYLAAYRKALENLYYNHTFPDGWRDENPDCDVESCGSAVFDVDDDAYEQWRLSFAGEGSEMRIPYVNLTLKNIQEMR